VIFGADAPISSLCEQEIRPVASQLFFRWLIASALHVILSTIDLFNIS
jgi:hypothetical protein